MRISIALMLVVAGCGGSNGATHVNACHGTITVEGVTPGLVWDNCSIVQQTDGSFVVGATASNCPKGDWTCGVAITFDTIGMVTCESGHAVFGVNDPMFAGSHEYGAACGSTDCPADAYGSCVVNSSRADANGWSGSVTGHVIDAVDLMPALGATVTVTGGFTNN